MTRSITRTKRGKGFSYALAGKKVDAATLSRISSLAIPPAWTDVEISLSKSAKVQATGYDSKGRKQYIYSASHSKKQERAKFDRITTFATHLPKLRKQVEKDLRRRRFDKRKVVAAAVRLLDQGYFRVGNEAYAKENKSYGLTTLRSKHVSIEDHMVVFDFIGKSGQKQHKVIKDEEIATIIAQLDTMPGYEIFRYQTEDGSLQNLSSSDVNEYLKTYLGDEYSAKDFRTWGGTLLAAAVLVKEVRANTKTARQKTVTACIKQVAQKLGNTPAIAKSSYIDPRIFTTYESSDSLHEMYKTVTSMRPKKYVSKDEQWVLNLLQK